MSVSRRSGPALGLAMLAILGGLAARRPDDPPRADPFEAVDADFRALYAGGRAATLGKIRPVIVVEMDKLVLIREGERVDAEVIPPAYHRLKSVSHVPLAVYVALAPHGDAPLDAGRIGRLREFRARVDAMASSLDDGGFTDDQRDRSRRLLRDCLAFLDGVVARGAYDPAALKALTRSAGPVVLANAADAARAQVDAYHARVSAWRKAMPAEEWSRLHVVVLGPQMPRNRNVAVRYFAKLMGLPGESRRLVYAEELSGEDKALNLLSTHRLDSELSVAFFDDPERMEIDLLGNAAAVYLDTLDLD